MRLALLVRELTQLAAQRRTYVLRAVFGLTLLLVFTSAYVDSIPRDGTQLGTGRRLLFALATTQLLGVLLIQPALMAGAIAGETQARTLESLILTGLSPWALLLQKLIARMLPTLSLLLLALPLFAACYLMGGLSRSEGLVAGWLIAVATLQSALVTLFASTLCRAPTTALLLSYGLLLGAHLGPPAALDLLGIGPADLAPPLALLLTCGLSPLAQLLRIAAGGPPGGMLSAQLLVLGSCAICALLARLFVLRGARPRAGRVQRAFASLDRAMETANARVGGIAWADARLPGDAPVAWRARARGVLGRPHHLVRALLVVTVPVIVLCALHFARVPRDPDGLVFAITGLWILAAAGLGSLAASAISAERTRGTLDLLLVTPMRGPRIVEQALRGLRRADWLVWVPLVLLVATHAASQPWREVLPAWQAGLTLLYAAVQIELIRWIGMLHGVRLATRGRAVLTTLLTLLAWAALPPMAGALLGGRESLPGLVLPALSPAVAVGLLTSGSTAAVGVVGLQLMVLGPLLNVLRNAVLDHADRDLGRPA